MKIGKLTDTYSATGQIEVSDIPQIAALGFTDVICNRPDGEVGAAQSCQSLAEAAKAAGLGFHVNPVSMKGPTSDNIAAQADILATTSGPVLAYCGSGMRASVCWSLANSGKMPTDEILKATASAGYNLEGLRAKLDAA